MANHSREGTRSSDRVDGVRGVCHSFLNRLEDANTGAMFIGSSPGFVHGVRPSSASFQLYSDHRSGVGRVRDIRFDLKIVVFVPRLFG